MDGSRGYLPHEALAHIYALTERANLFIQVRQPWAIAKDASRSAELHDVLAALVRSLGRQAIHLAPFIPGKAQALWSQLGAPGGAGAVGLDDAASLSVAGWRVTKGEGLFPRPEPRVE